MKKLWIWLWLWLVVGLVLEYLIGTKSSAYLAEDIRRELWRLAHAHGVLLSAIALLCDGLLGWEGKAARPLMVFGAIAMPLGFLLGGCWPNSTDPHALVFIAPLGGLAFVTGLGLNLSYRLRKD